jgi:transcriptional regulator with XRE-family HTH domain
MRKNLRDARLLVASNVKRLRDLRRLSQERLAELAGTSNKSVSEVERGVTNVRIDQLAAIATGLSVTMADLFTPTRVDQSNVRTLLMTDRELTQLEQTVGLVARAIKRAKRD